MREALGRTLHDIAQTLESSDGSEQRIVRVLALLRAIVPFEQCALLGAHPGRAPQLFVVPGTTADVRATLTETLGLLHRRLVDERAHPLEPGTRRWGDHLAIPLVGNDQTIGVLMVRAVAPQGSAGSYTEQHLRELSIVAAQLASYLLMVEQARQLDDARRAAEAAGRIKDQVLALVSRELETPLPQGELIDEIRGLGCGLGPSSEQLVADPIRVVTVISNLLVHLIRSTAPGPGGRRGAGEQPLAGIRVLLVDDDEEMLLAASTVLELHGAEVTAVASAAAALAVLERMRPHVLLSDISMSSGNGYDLMREVSARELAIPSAALTSLAREEDRRRALAAGFQMHLAKPFHAEELVAVVATLARPVLAS